MPERTWALTKSFPSRPGHDTHTHIYIYIHPKDTKGRYKEKRTTFLYFFLLVLFCFVLKNPFLSFQFRCQLPSVLYYLFYFKRKEHEREYVWVVGCECVYVVPCANHPNHLSLCLIPKKVSGEITPRTIHLQIGTV